ncbi:MAG TPA: F0F1 ATP synthase subunit B [Nitrospiria bacterium]|nr:F0F1 ATP synthase subunit B [Nitrospiria bacterium]
MPQFDTQFFTPLLFWSFVSFGILFFFLYKFGLPPLMNELETREKKIRESLDHAEKVQKEAKALMAEYETRIKAARQEAETIIEKARARSQQILEEGDKKSRQESEKALASTREEMEREKIKLMKEIRQYTGDLVVLATEKILQKALRDEDHKKMIEEAVESASRGLK